MAKWPLDGSDHVEPLLAGVSSEEERPHPLEEDASFEGPVLAQMLILLREVALVLLDFVDAVYLDEFGKDRSSLPPATRRTTDR